MTVKDIVDIKGGKDTGNEDIYGQMGKIKGIQEAILVSIADIKESIANLWTKFDASQAILHKTAKELIEEHESNCPLNMRVENIEKERDKNTLTFRWFVSILLTIITIIVSIGAIKGWSK